MPLYEYKCLCCSTQFEIKHSFDDKPVVTCPKCQGAVQRVFSPVPVIFKGTGFYTTDNRNSAPEEPSETLCS